MPRAKTIPDEAVLAGATRVMVQHGPADFTLADVARVVGIAPATLVQRFGGKAALVQRVMAQSNEALAATVAATPVERSGAAVVALLVGLAEGFGDGGSVADHLLWLREDFRDPALNRLARERFAMLRTAIAARLPPLALPPETAARLVEAQWHGAVIQWGLAPQGTLPEAVRRALTDWFALLGVRVDRGAGSVPG